MSRSPVLALFAVFALSSSTARAEEVPLEALPGVRLRAAFALALAGSGEVALRGDGPGDLVGLYEGTSGIAAGAEVRGGWVHGSGFGMELRIGAAGLSLLEEARRAVMPTSTVDRPLLVEVGPTFSFGRALPLERVALEMRLEAGAAWARVVREPTQGISLHVGAELGIFFTPHFAVVLGAGYRWVELLDPDRVKGGEVYLRLGPTVRFP